MDQFIVLDQIVPFGGLVGNYEVKKMHICVLFRELSFLGTTVWKKSNF